SRGGRGGDVRAAVRRAPSRRGAPVAHLPGRASGARRPSDAAPLARDGDAVTRGRAAAGLGAAGTLTVAGAARAVAARWPRVLLSALGLCQLLMAAAAPPWLTAVGAVSGVALVLAAWLPARTGVLVALVLLG